MVATDMSPVLLRCEPELRCDFVRSFALLTRRGTSERSEELIYSYVAEERKQSKQCKPRGFVMLVVFQNGPQRRTILPFRIC